MLIGFGKPEVLVPKLVEQLQAENKVKGVWAQWEYTTEEMNMLENLKAKLPNNVKLHQNDSKTLIPYDKLPFDGQTKTPDVYTSFRKKVEGLGLELGGGMLVEPLKTAVNAGEGWKVRVGDKDGVKPFPDVKGFEVDEKKGGWVKNGDEADSIEGMYAKLSKPLIDAPPIGGWTQAAKGTEVPPMHSSTAIPLKGGESSAVGRLDDYLGHSKGENGGWTGGEKAKNYKATRNGLVGEAFSTKFAAFLSLGTLSAKEAGWRIGQLMEETVRDKAVYNNVYCEQLNHGNFQSTDIFP
jgi:deoxyribodipyrimidine photo-lyase